MIRKDMRGLFFVMKGQYRKGVLPSFTNPHTGDTNYIGGYDPESESTEEWYGLYDSVTFNCVACGGDLNKVVHGVYNQIVHFKGDKSKYLRKVNYKASPAMMGLYKEVYSTYGHHYDNLIEKWEDEAYDYLETHSPKGRQKKFQKSFRGLKKTKASPVTEVEVTPVKKTSIKPKFRKKHL